MVILLKFVNRVVENDIVNKLFKLVISILLSLIFAYFLFRLGKFNYVIFHTAVELYTIIGAFIILAIVVNTIGISQNHFFAFLGIAYGFVGILDLLHTFTYSGVTIISWGGTNVSAQIWIVARYLQSISILISFIYIKRKINIKLAFTVYTVLVVGLLASIFYYKIFPDCFIYGVGLTRFKIVSEYIIILIFLLSIIMLILFKDYLRFKVFRYILFSLSATIACELMFTTYKTVLDDVVIFAHIIRFASYYFFYTATIVTSLKNPMNHIFFELEKVKQELAEKNEEIIRSNDQLKQDLADLQMIEKLLRKSKAWSRAIFEGSSIGIVLLNVSGVIIEANPAFERITGYNSEELRDIGMHNITPSYEDDGDEQLFKELIEGKLDSYELEKRYVKKDGSIIWANLKMSYIQNTGEDFQFIIAMVEDITQKKVDEHKQQQLMKELEITNRELDGFAYIVSHDLKAPLRGIGSLAGWLVKDYDSKLDKEGKELIALITNRVERMKSFIDGILQYSRVSRISEIKTDLDLNNIINEVIEFILFPDNICIVFENKLPIINGYKIYMEQVFQNLISNSIKFMDKEKGEIRIGAVEKDDYCIIKVADNGSGIDKKYYDKIFQIFQTLQPRDKFESTGIGLSIVKKIMENCGGKVWVESQLGKGSSFYIKIPKY